MPASLRPTVQIDLDCIQRSAAQIVESVGVPVYATVKSDAYGLGLMAVAAALRDIVDGFCVFNLMEAAAARLWNVAGKPILAIGPPRRATADHFLAQHVRPAVTTVRQAEALRAASPAVSVDTGMQRFGCAAEDVEEIIAAGHCTEALTHGFRPEHARKLYDLLGGRGLTLHAAGSALL